MQLFIDLEYRLQVLGLKILFGGSLSRAPLPKVATRGGMFRPLALRSRRIRAVTLCSLLPWSRNTYRAPPSSVRQPMMSSPRSRCTLGWRNATAYWFWCKCVSAFHAS